MEYFGRRTITKTFKIVHEKRKKVSSLFTKTRKHVQMKQLEIAHCFIKDAFTNVRTARSSVPFMYRCTVSACPTASSRDARFGGPPRCNPKKLCRSRARKRSSVTRSPPDEVPGLRMTKQRAGEPPRGLHYLGPTRPAFRNCIPTFLGRGMAGIIPYATPLHRIRRLFHMRCKFYRAHIPKPPSQDP